MCDVRSRPINKGQAQGAAKGLCGLCVYSTKMKVRNRKEDGKIHQYRICAIDFGLLTIYLATRALLQAGEHTQQPALEPRRVLGGAGGLVDL